MTPLELSIAIHYHCMGRDYRDGDFSSIAVRIAIDHFLALGLLEPTGGELRKYKPTGRLHAFVTKLTEIPLPVSALVFKET